MKQIHVIFLMLGVAVYGCSTPDDTETSPPEIPTKSGEVLAIIDGTEYAFSEYLSGISAHPVFETKNTYANTFGITCKNAEWIVELKCLELSKGDGGNFIKPKTYPMSIGNVYTSKWCMYEIDDTGDTTRVPCGGGHIDITDRVDWWVYRGYKAAQGFVEITTADTKAQKVSGHFDSWVILEKSRFSKDSFHVSGSFKDIEYTYNP